jgi:hypothetical protein
VDFGVVVAGVLGVGMGTGVEAGVETLVVPNWAKGFGLPIVTSGIKTMLESCNPIKAGLEKIESSNFIVLTLNNKVRKLCATEELSPIAPAPAPELFVLVGVTPPDDTKLVWSEEGDLIKKI